MRYRAFQWKKWLPPAGVRAEGSELPAVWRSVKPADPSGPYVLEALFKPNAAKPRPPLAKRSAPRPEGSPAVRLGEKRRLQISSMMEQMMRFLRRSLADTRPLSAAPAELQALVMQLPASVFGTHDVSSEAAAAADDRLQLLITCLPPPRDQWASAPRKPEQLGEWGYEECQLLGQLVKLEHSQGLEEPEDFVWRMLQLDRVKERLAAFRLLHLTLEPRLSALTATLKLVSDACSQLVHSASTSDGMLFTLCGKVLALGNAINQGHKVYGDAKGFALEGLLELGRYHATDGRTRGFEGALRPNMVAH